MDGGDTLKIPRTHWKRHRYLECRLNIEWITVETEVVFYTDTAVHVNPLHERQYLYKIHRFGT